jgi:molybdopterin molybdotransferase
MVSLGIREVQVRGRPRVAVLSTGSELTSARRPRKGKTVESHSFVFLRLAQVLGCIAVDMGIVRDEQKALRASLRSALSKSNFVLTLGGTSAGKHDLVVDAVSSLQPDVLVHGLRLDRGRVTGMASVRSKPIMMLPGPIQAAANAFLVAGVPIIAKLSGSKQTGLSIPCVLGAPWVARKKFSDFEKVVYVKLGPGHQTVANPIAGETESMKLLTSADGYFVAPKNVARLEAGDPVEVKLVPGFSFA